MESNTAVNLSKKIRALESSGFSSDEINEVLKQLGTANAAANNIHYGESIGSWILNFGLPSMVVFGTGALFYYLTGGEDEPAIIAEVGDNNAVNCDINNGSHFQEEETANFDEERTLNNGNNQGVNQFYNDSSIKKSATGNDDTARRSADRPFRNPASYIPESDPEKDPSLDNMFGEVSQQWLKELLLLSNTMAADIKTIKEEITTLKSKGGEGRRGASGSSNNSIAKDSDIESIESAAVPAAPELDTEGYQAVLRCAFRLFLNCRQTTTAAATASATSSGAPAEGEDKSITASEIANDEALKKGCQALSMYAKKVLDNPTQPRYRKISMSNASFKNLVQPLKGHIEVLSAIGFIATVTTTPCFEWTWYFDFSEEDKSKSATAAASVKRVGKPDVSGVKDILNECIRFLDICTTQGLSSLEKELNTFDVVPAIVDATKEVDDEIINSAADPKETTLTVTGTDAGSSSSSSGSREKHAGTDNEGGSDGTATTASKSLEKSSNITAELTTESISNAVEQSTEFAGGKVNDTPSDEIPVSVAPQISAESPSLLFSDIMKFVSKPPA